MSVGGRFTLEGYGAGCWGTAMTKLEIFEFQNDEPGEGHSSKAYRILWSVLCWTLAFAAVIVTSTAFMRWGRYM
jgi:hypothetical protein